MAAQVSQATPNGVLIVAVSAFRRRTSKDLPLDPGVPERGALLAVPVDPLLRRVDPGSATRRHRRSSGPSPCAVAARRGALLAALNMGDQVMQRLCTCANDKAGDQQVSPEWR